MRKLFFITALILVISIFSFAQAIPDPSCPSISVNGPAGIVEPDEVARYTATVDTKGQKLDLKYVWSVSVGKILSGQGTLTIEVRQPEHDSLTVTIEVKGVPEGCPISASETASIDFAPDPIKLAQFDGATFATNSVDLDKIVRAMKDNPNNQLYVYFAYKQETLGKAAESREQHVVDYLATALGDRSRLTVVRRFDGVDIVQFWRVPPGADNPRCDACDVSSCPSIEVIGPDSITEPGETISFSLYRFPKNLENLNYKWTVSAGVIIKGQGKPWITVQTTCEMDGENVRATVEIGGLAKDCPNTRSESAPVAAIRDFFPSDEFGKLKPAEEKGRLDAFLHEMLVAKNQIGYIVLRVARNTTATKLQLRIKRIKDHIFAFRKFPRERIVILVEPHEREETVFWRAGAEFGEIICPSCKRY